MFYFIVNPHARSDQGMDIWKKAEEILAAEKVEYEVFFTKYTGHAKELAKQIAVLSLPCTLTVLGGDGTLNEVIDGLAQTDFSRITLGYIPMWSLFKAFFIGVFITLRQISASYPMPLLTRK